MSIGVAIVIAGSAFMFGFLAGFLSYLVIIRAACNSGTAFLKVGRSWYPYNPFRNGEPPNKA